MMFRRLRSAEKAPCGVTFSVDDVTPAETPVSTEWLRVNLERRLERKVFAVPDAYQPVVHAAFDEGRVHPLIDAVHGAFSTHRPLTLSADAIWLTIAQGFGHHIAAESQKLRYRLVRHEGRTTLTAKVGGLRLADFEGVIADFSTQIREATDPVLHETLVCDFSTTTPVIRTASEVALMDTFSSYFEYEMRCVCGIPKITLEGTVEDWQRIRARVEVLATYDLEWWVARLRPILDEFVRAADGHPTAEFWKAIYKPEYAYGVDLATGWITDLFPYLRDAPERRRNHVFEFQRHRWALPAAKARGPFAEDSKGVGLKGFPSGLSSVPIEVRFTDGSERKMELVAGFFAVKQDSELAIAPLIAWCVADLPPTTEPDS